MKTWRQQKFAHWYADIAALVIILIVIGITVSTYFDDGKRIIGQDATVYYLPMWSYLGDRLGSWQLPGWNPHQYGGSPFAADPESGWMYLPVMIIFSLFNVATGATLFLIVHFLLAGIGAYLFARLLGLNVPGATVTGLAYTSSNFFYRMSVSSPAYIQSTSWLPWAFLFIELSVRTRARTPKIIFSGLAAFAFGQIVAAWLGKGAYYSLLILGAYLLYRTLVEPIDRATGWRDRMVNLVTIGAGMAIWTTLLSAGGLLPRLQYESVSNLASGYQDTVANTGGGSIWNLPLSLIGQSGDSPGNIIILLAIVAVIIAGKRFCSPFFAGAIFVSILLYTRETEWFQKPFLLLPLFDTVHLHWPQQIMQIAYLPFAILAGSAVSLLVSNEIRWNRRILAVATPIVLAALLAADTMVLTTDQRIADLAVMALVGCIVLFRLPQPWRIVLVGVIAVLHLVPFYGRTEDIAQHRSGPVMQADLTSYYRESGAVEYMKDVMEETGQPVRYFGYDPAYGVSADGFWIPYRRNFANPMVQALQVNNRASALRIYDIQGQNNPIQIALYSDLFTALNGAPQDYHEATVFESGLNSPILDLLNVQYIIIPLTYGPDRADLDGLTRRYDTVYQTDRVRVLDRGTNIGAAFLVPGTVEVHSTDEALALMRTSQNGAETPVGPSENDPATGSINLVNTAPVEGPALTGNDPSMPNGTATITSYRPESIEVQTSAAGERQLVISEIVYPGWRAYIDGKNVPIQTAYGAFRSVRLPAGDHTVEFRFESTPLVVGTWISVLGYLALIGSLLWIWLGSSIISFLPSVRTSRAPSTIENKQQGNPDSAQEEAGGPTSPTVTASGTKRRHPSPSGTTAGSNEARADTGSDEDDANG